MDSVARSGRIAKVIAGLAPGTAAESVDMLLAIGLPAAAGIAAALGMQRRGACSDFIVSKYA